MALYMKFGSINGDATLPGHSGWVSIKSFGWAGGTGHGGQGGPGGQSTGGRVVYEPVRIIKAVDNATVPLIKALAQRETLDKITLHVATTRDNKAANVDFEIIFKTARIVAVDYALVDGGNEERISYYFNSYEMTVFDVATGAGRATFIDMLSDTR